METLRQALCNTVSGGMYTRSPVSGREDVIRMSIQMVLDCLAEISARRLTSASSSAMPVPESVAGTPPAEVLPPPMPAAEAPVIPRTRLPDASAPADGCTKAEVLGFLPPSCTATKETQWHHRWRVLCPGPRRTSKSFGGAFTERMAVGHIVVLAWKQSPLLDCPWGPTEFTDGASVSSLV